MKNCISIPVHIYKLWVSVIWDMPKRDIYKWAEKSNVPLSPAWRRVFDDLYDSRATGFCLRLGENNSDIIVYLRNRPKRCISYGTLYHELFHAVQFISRDHDMHDETESPAYLFEFLVTQCNQYFWNEKLTKKEAC